jgi:hypothetical protein
MNELRPVVTVMERALRSVTESDGYIGNHERKAIKLTRTSLSRRDYLHNSPKPFVFHILVIHQVEEK